MALPAAYPFPKLSSFYELVNTRFQGASNAVCWERKPEGNFAEIIELLTHQEDIAVLDTATLQSLKLTEQGALARSILLSDFQLLQAHGASPTLNIIRCYERDEADTFFPTDVYSWHVDRSPIPTDTFLCTYYGAPSEILLNHQAQQKITIPHIRAELMKLYNGPPKGFDDFLAEHCLDLHYEALPSATPISLGNGHLWRLAVDHPGSLVLPCIHRAPAEKQGVLRLLMIC